jgi:transmembrane sensor
MNMKYTNKILQIVTGNLKGSLRNEFVSQLSKNDETREEYIKIKNVWALASSTKGMSEAQIERLYLDFKKQQVTKKKSFQLTGITFLKYAALVILALSVGAAGFLGLYQNQKSYVYSIAADSGKNSKSQLQLSNGTIVDLEKDNSKIALTGDQKITIDNEKVIDLNKTSQPDDSKMNEVVVPFGKKTQLTLEDGTKVWLNAGSRMAFPTKFQGNKREVFLEGEGYFEVAHNSQKPFYVNTNEIAIKVLGTRFNISDFESENLIETILIEGSVAISERSALSFMKKESILAPNQKASYNRDDRSMVVKDEPNVYDAIAWIEGWCIFHRQSINDVLNKLERYYNVQFEFSTEFPAEDLITGKLFLNDSIDQVMMTLEVVARLQYRLDGHKIYIEKIGKVPMKK